MVAVLPVVEVPVVVVEVREGYPIEPSQWYNGHVAVISVLSIPAA